jgi:hypothetical protein
MSDGPSNEKEIGAYIHCGKCLRDIPAGVSPAEYARTEAGWTPRGLQLWCRRHDLNIMHVDFEGHRHKANTTARDPEAAPPPGERH